MAYGTKKKQVNRWDRGSRKAYWSRQVADWAASGVSVSAYCLAHGVSAERLYWWRRHLDNGGQVSGTPVAAVAGRPLFKEVTLPEPFVSAGGPLEVVAPGGTCVRVYPGFDAPTLARVLAVVESRSC